MLRCAIHGSAKSDFSVERSRPILEQILCKCLARKHFHGKCPYAMESLYIFSLCLMRCTYTSSIFLKGKAYIWVRKLKRSRAK
jgi:hypothetical protein